MSTARRDLMVHLLDHHGELWAQGLTRVIGIEVKCRLNGGDVAELGMWVPDRELLIPNPRNHPGLLLEFPCTVHTLHGDLNYAMAQVR